MKRIVFSNRVLRSSTAIAVGLAMTGAPQMIAFAQDQAAPIDCIADAENPACAEVPAVEAPVVEEPIVEEAQTEAPTVEEPAAESAPVEAEPVEPAPVETAPVETEPAPEAEVEAAPVETPPAAEAPAEEAAPAEVEPEADAVVESEVEQAEPEQAEPEPVEPEQVEPEAETPVEAPTADDQPVEEAPAESEPSSETTAGEPAVEQPVADQPTDDAADDTQPNEETAAPEPAAQDDTAAEPDASQDDEQAAETPEQPETVANEAAVVDESAPTSVVADETTAEQSAQIEAREERRREEARERRNELLGAAAVGAVIGAIIPALGGTVVEDQGDRLIVERDGEYFVRRDESSLLRDGDVDVRAQRLNNGWTQETVTRRNGAQVITIRDQGGFVVYRSRIRPNGREVVLIDNREIDDRVVIDFTQQLPPLQLTIPQDRYIVPARQANYDVIYQTFAAQPVQEVEQVYTLRQVRESERLRDLVRRVDLDTITFDTGQAIVRQSQVPLLEDLARASIALIEKDPSTVLLIEGHTDAVGSDISNLALSDRRAETVARILANFYGVPPESMVVQGYGEQYLKVATQGAEERNRRVTIRNITSLLSSR